VTVLFALLAALANAVEVVTQHVASTGAPAKTSGWRLVLYLLRSPLWLLGWVALIGSFVLQALALHDGPLSVVQPLLVTELVFALVLRQVWLRQSIRTAAWTSAAVTAMGLGVFIAVAEPRGGDAVPTSHVWTAVVIVCLGAAAAMALLARSGSPGRRAGLYAAAAGTVWALEATFIKTTTDTLTQFGVGGTFERWPVYALAVGGIAGFLLEQAALHVGPLRISQPVLVIVDPVVSIVLGVWLFDEHFTEDPLTLVIAVLAFAVMCVGAVFLTRTAPETMEAAPSP
jgi:hypothetical protein